MVSDTQMLLQLFTNPYIAAQNYGHERLAISSSVPSRFMQIELDKKMSVMRYDGTPNAQGISSTNLWKA